MNNEIVVTALDYDYQGYGVAKHDDLVIFVKDLLVNETALIEIETTKKNFATARVIKYLTQSPARVKPICPIHHLCGGCDFMHANPEEQRLYKTGMVKTTLERVGGINSTIIPMEAPVKDLHYRNKIQVHFMQKNGVIQAGFYAQKSNTVIPFETCYVAEDAINVLHQALIEVLNQLRLTVYNPKSEKGLLRHAVYRQNHVGELMLILVVSEEKVTILDKLITELIQRVPALKSIVLNTNKGNSKHVLGKKFTTLYGQETLTDQLSGLTFEISAPSFFQVNRNQTEVLYAKAIALLSPTKKDIIVDAYSGIGTIALALASQVSHVYGIESFEIANKNAMDNAKSNHIENVTFLTGTVEEVLPKLLEEKKVTGIVFDPPRQGLEGTFIDTISALKIPKVVYISCNVKTLARDLKLFEEQGYTVHLVEPVDMFAQTTHVETITLLSLKTA